VLDELASGDSKSHSRAARLRLASLAYSSGQKPEAHRLVDEILSEHPKDAEARNAKARLLLEDGSIKEAAEAARAAIAADAESAAAHYTLGLTSIALEHFDDAEREFEKVLQLNPRAAAPQLQLARLRLASGDTGRAVSNARKAVEAMPTDPAAAVLLARGLRAEGDISKAQETLAAPIIRGFAIQTLVWSALEVMAAAVRWQVLAMRDVSSARRLDHLTWFTVGLDVGIVGVGVTALAVAWLSRRRLDLTGAGLGIIVQGLGLLVLDLTFASTIARLI